jgi:hypothetical protein
MPSRHIETRNILFHICAVSSRSLCMMKTEFPTNGELPIPKDREHRRRVAIQDHHDNRSEHLDAEDSSGKEKKQSLFQRPQLMNTTFETTNSKSRVLIVDDNSRFARSAQLFLEHTGNYFACAVNDPRRALETARSFKPDLGGRRSYHATNRRP